MRLFGAKIGNNVHIYPSVRVWAPWNLEIYDNVGIGDRSILYSMDKIIIRSRVVISQGSHLCTGSHDYNRRDFRLITAPIVILDSSWICAECFVSPGVTIAEGSVIAPRSVVAKSVPDSWGVWAGAPIRRIGNRNGGVV